MSRKMSFEAAKAKFTNRYTMRMSPVTQAQAKLIALIEE